MKTIKAFLYLLEMRIKKEKKLILVNNSAFMQIFNGFKRVGVNEE